MGLDERRREVVQKQIESLEGMAAKMLEMWSNVLLQTSELGYVSTVEPDPHQDIGTRLRMMADEFDRLARQMEPGLDELPRKSRKLHKRLVEQAEYSRQLAQTLSSLKGVSSQ